MKQRKHLPKAHLAVAFILVCCTLATAQVLRPRNPNAPVVKPTSPTNPPPGSDAGIIIVGGKGNKPVTQHEVTLRGAAGQVLEANTTYTT